jgi:DNA-binding Xre family transcriptional regulator
MSAPDSCLTLNRQKLLEEVNRRQIKREMLAEEIGVTPRTLRRWLHGQTTRVQMMHLDQLARRLGCAVTDLIADEPGTDLPFQSPDVHPLLLQLRRYVLQEATQENFECATRLVHGNGSALPFDIQAAALYEYARFAFQLGHISQAQRAFERAVLKADAAGLDVIRFQSFLSLAQLSSVQHDEGGEREGLFLEQAEHVLARMRVPHWRPYLWLMEARHALTQGQLDKAQALGDNALHVLQEEPGETTLDRIESYDILSTIFHAVGSRRKALDILDHASIMVDEILYQDHPMRGRILMRQSTVNGLLGKLTLSIEQGRQGVRILERFLPLEHADMTLAWLYFGASLCDFRQYDEGLAAIEKSLQGHPDHEARCRTNYGLFLQRMGRLEESADEGKKAVELFQARLGLEHPETAAALGRSAGPIQAMGQYETAEKMYRDAARLLHQADPFHVRILDQVRNQADCLLHMNRAEEAAQILKEHRRIYTKRDENPAYQGRYSLLQARALARLPQKKQEALSFAQEARTRFQSADIDPTLRHETETLIQSLRYGSLY